MEKTKISVDKVWKVVGAIFLSAGIFICLAALLALGIRVMKISKLKNSAEEYASDLCWVAELEDDKLGVYFKEQTGCIFRGLLREYVSTGLPIKQLDWVMVYYDKNNRESPMVVDLLDEDGNPAMVTEASSVIAMGAMLCALGIAILVEIEILSKIQVSDQNGNVPWKMAGRIFLSAGIFCCVAALLLLGVRDMRIKEIKNSAEEIKITKGYVSQISGNKIDIWFSVFDDKHLTGAFVTSGLSRQEYVSTAFNVRPGNLVMVYYDVNNREIPIVVDRLDRNGDPIIVTAGPLVIFMGVVLGILGIIILVREKTLSKVQDSQS